MNTLHLSDLQRDALIDALEDEIHATKRRIRNKECGDVEAETTHLYAIREVLLGLVSTKAA